jgi:hypothetical protein
VLLNIRRSYPSEKRFLVQLEQSQRQLELKIERAVRNELAQTTTACYGLTICGKTASNASRSTAATSNAGDSFVSENSPMGVSPTSGGAGPSFHNQNRTPNQSRSPGRSPSRSPSPVPTPLLEELRQRRLTVLRNSSAAALADRTCYIGPVSEATSISGASQKSSSQTASDGMALKSGSNGGALLGIGRWDEFSTENLKWRHADELSQLTVETPPLAESPTVAKSALQRPPGPCIGTNAHLLVKSPQGPLSRPASPPDGMLTPSLRPTHNAALPPADGLPGTQPDDAQELPRYMCVTDNDELPRLVRQANSRGGSRCTTPAEAGRRLARSDSSPADIKKADSILRGRLSPVQSQVSLSHALSIGAAGDYVAASRSQLMEMREMVLPTRRCTREQQARPQRACLAECGRNLVGR